MAMTRPAVPGGGDSSGGRTVVVGLKLGPQSRELLTWALVRAAQANDRVVALHVLNDNEIVNGDGKFSLLSLVEAFDSILHAYEGFCSLKQIDLKLKICQGYSVSRIVVREAKAYRATGVVLGAARAHRTIRSSASVAKYCAKKLSRECSIYAVVHGKVVFRRESKAPSCVGVKETEHQSQNSLLYAVQRSFGKNIKALNNVHYSEKACTKLELSLSSFKSVPRPLERKCSICSPDSFGLNLMAIIPAQELEAASSSISLLLGELPEMKPGWPLLRRAIVPNKTPPFDSRARQLSVVQWALRLPDRCCLSIENSTRKDTNEFSSGAIVYVGNETLSVPKSPDRVSGGLPEELKGLHEKYAARCRLFKFQELVTATSDFVPGNMIGKGGSSRVYRGCLPDGKELAVKILKPSADVVNEFILEIEIIMALHHKNIISLFGFCFEDSNLLLVYDLLPRGSLEENLHGVKNEPSAFGWSERYRVAIGVAHALDYLHNREEQGVIHRDVKSSNILLSDDYEPQLSDFGLAKWASATSTHVTCTGVAGTFGYLAPEYFMYGKVNEKIDVYAYGVVLLELLSGRKPISSNCPKGQESLVMWAKPHLNSEKFALLLDPNLGSTCDQEQAERMVLAASLCISRAPRARPQANLVLKLLQGDAEVVKWARHQVNASEGSQIKLDTNSPDWPPDAIDDETYSQSNLQSHLKLALLGVEDDSSTSSIGQSVSLQDYLQQGRWSRSSSFD